MFDMVFDRQLILTSATACARRQQNKVLKSIQDNLNPQSFNDHADPRILTIITEHMNIVKDMKLHTLSDIDKKKLLVCPQVFQLDHIVDPKKTHFMHLCHTSKKKNFRENYFAISFLGV